ncbi:MAG: hypothetical protein AAGJ18_12060 [Bacteroidota bacterium]
MKRLKSNWLIVGCFYFLVACGSSDTPSVDTTTLSADEQMKATMAEAEANIKRAQEETARIIAASKAKEDSIQAIAETKLAEERKSAAAAAAVAAKKEAARKKQAARKGVYVEAMCGPIEYCLEDKNGIKCYKLKSKEKQFRECIVPVKVYHAKNGKKTTVAAEIKRNQEKKLLCT